VEFGEALAQKLYAIDGEAFAKNAGESGRMCSMQNGLAENSSRV
jgi:hypothetical protein